MNDLEKTKLLKRSLHQIRQLKQALKAKTVREPIAVIGMACRFPGGSTTPEKFWELLMQGKEGLRDVPGDRWDSRQFYAAEAGKPLKMYIQKSNFLMEDVSQFDSKLFGISAQEATEMDPQHRLLLELTWEALERAGQNPEALRGQAVGTFIGIILSEYSLLTRDLKTIGPYSMTGLTNHMASGRIAHVFGFHGPALSIDTASSSSMVSIHQACLSLQNNECELAVTGGVGLMLSPLPFINLCKLQALSRDGRCKSFAADADGYGRGEGAGLIILKRLSAAQRDRDPILALIQGSHINHNGPSSGLSVPNGNAQTNLLEQAFEQANIQPEQMDYLEVHCTGTSLGDPIEFQTLKNIFSQKRSKNNPLILGTCKANIGHLEAASGVAGVIKTVLSLVNKTIPAHIHCDELNPRIPLETIPSVLPQSAQKWEIQNGASSRIAGVNSFGFSGTNAFVILQQAPEQVTENSESISERPKHILSLSAQSQQALNELIERYLSFLSSESLSQQSITDLASIAFTANTGRAQFAVRLACVWADRVELLSSLRHYRQTKQTDSNSYYADVSVSKAAKITLVFPATISGDLSIFAELVNNYPVFRDSWQRCEDLFLTHTSRRLIDLLSNSAADTNATNKTDAVDKAALVFSLMYASFELIRDLGIQINTVYAEKDGLYAMAAATGMLSLQQAVGALLQPYIAKQTQAVRSLPIKLNMPRLRVLLPGRTEALKRKDLTDSTLLEKAYAVVIRRDEMDRPVKGQSVKDQPVKDQLAQPFWDQLRKQLSKKNQLICELNTSPQLLAKIYRENLVNINYTTVLHPDSAWDGVLHFIAKCYSAGHAIDWKRFDQGYPRKKVLCPTYPFQTRSYWLETIANPLFAQTVSPQSVADEQRVAQENESLLDSSVET